MAGRGIGRGAGIKKAFVGATTKKGGNIIATLLNTNKELETSIFENERELESKGYERTRLADTLAILKKKRDNKQTEIDDCNNQIQRLQEQKQTTNKITSSPSLQSSVARPDIDAMIAVQKEKITALDIENKSTLGEIKTIETQLKKCEDIVKDKTSTLTKLKENYEKNVKIINDEKKSIKSQKDKFYSEQENETKATATPIVTATPNHKNQNVPLFNEEEFACERLLQFLYQSFKPKRKSAPKKSTFKPKAAPSTKGDSNKQNTSEDESKINTSSDRTEDKTESKIVGEQETEGEDNESIDKIHTEGETKIVSESQNSEPTDVSENDKVTANSDKEKQDISNTEAPTPLKFSFEVLCDFERISVVVPELSVQIDETIKAIKKRLDYYFYLRNKKNKAKEAK
eukprot:TRINITY_DN1900_c0_g1_i4.p1 TRINITY_DN1900_c0_g1~~TRINITY_DN1900_c0_g1_i4.p1  ORF type:complete len:402 (+),score=96.17 TRINITY_DN1900_c0_g1_i4:120-1325(+)